MALLTITLGDNGTLVDAARVAGFDGMVVEATGGWWRPQLLILAGREIERPAADLQQVRLPAPAEGLASLR